MLRTSDRSHTSFEQYVPNSFFDALRALEYIYEAMPQARTALDELVDKVSRTLHAICNCDGREDAFSGLCIDTG